MSAVYSLYMADGIAVFKHEHTKASDKNKCYD